MRISTAWAQQMSVNAMNTQQSKLAKVQQQISTGLKVSTPAEDPAAAVRVLDLNKTISKTDQYQSNISTARSRLNVEESALDTGSNILFRVQELTIQAMSSAIVNSDDRLAIKFEIDELTEQLAGIANTKNANGEFIFAGEFSTAPAFVKSSITGEYDYEGGTVQRSLQIGDTRQVADGDLGSAVFVDIASSNPSTGGTRSIFNTMKALSDWFNGDYVDNDPEVTDILGDIDSALNSFLEARTGVGARLNALDNQELQNEKFVLDTKTTLSETQDLDYADAISQFHLQSTALQAAQQTFAKVNNLSLFNYL
ncbi:MAG: flagellar hook-associated protein FlgL [Methylobacter sp.]|jgi:flagellar hook-associated protein 3 FlgL|nr:flagellar hook-associated protein FlgL [Methylobacter sp.]